MDVLPGLKRRHQVSKSTPEQIQGIHNHLEQGRMPVFDPETLEVSWVVEKPGDTRDHLVDSDVRR